MRVDKLPPQQYEGPIAARTYPKITSFFADVPDGKLLDIGAGMGHVANRIYHMGGFDVYACDARMPLEHNRIDPKNTLTHDHLKWTKINLNESLLPYPSDMFDYAICIDVLEHLENPRRMIREMARVMKKGGMGVISTPFVSSLPQRIYFLFTGKLLHFPERPPLYAHVTPVSMTIINDEFAKAGLVIEKVVFDRGWLPLLRLRMPAIALFGDTIIIQFRKK